jgi:DTW domain-containing protein YfiP
MSNNLQANPSNPSLAEEQETCPRCTKPLALCVCDQVGQVETKLSMLILMHPQEQDKTLGTARLAAQHVKNSVLKIGLSWPSLTKVLGREVDPQRWAVLYLGSADVKQLQREADDDTGVVFVTSKGVAEADQRSALRGIEGVILLDGSWSQVKTLWWRNPWLLKCRRVVLTPHQPSRYGRLRREPKREGLSTIEAAGMLIARIDRKPETEERFLASFETMLNAYRKALPTMPELAPKPRRRSRKR